MKTKKVQKIVGGYLGKIADVAAKVEDGYDEEVIHALRVNVKRLRAFLRCYWLFTGGAKPAFSKSLGKIYKAAGEVRDLQLLLKQVNKDGLPEIYSEAIERQLAAAKQGWGETYRQKKLAKALRKIEEYDYKSIPSFMPAEFIKSRLTLVDELRAAGMADDEDLHTVRKKIKDIIYVVRLVNEHWAKARAVIQHIPLARFEELADNIGAYNDARQMKMLIGNVKVKGAIASDVKARRAVVSRLGKNVKAEKVVVENLVAEMADSKFF